MNAQRKKAAVTKYVALKDSGKNKEELLELINADEKKYTPDEVLEIIGEVLAEKKQGSTPPPSKKKKADVEGEYYEEWDVQISGGKYKKLTISRPVVKITEEEAENLNKGVVEGGNAYAKMYFLPE